jgi:hypothetical protein
MDRARPPQLDYAAPLPWRRRKVVRRSLAGGLVVLSAIVWAPGFWNRVQVLWWQRQCLAYVAPADQVVYDDGPAVPQLLSGGGMISPKLLVPSPAPVAARPAKCWDRLYQLIQPGASHGSGGVLYLHRGQTPSGAERLVVVALEYRISNVLAFECWELSLASPITEIGHRSNTYHLPVTFDASDKPLRLYAGQPAPNDPSRFTIRYDLDGQRGTIEGWVSEGGSVSLEVKDGPAKVR